MNVYTDALQDALQGIQRAADDIVDRLVQALVDKCKTVVEAVKRIPRNYRARQRPMPSEPSDYAVKTFKPLSDFLAANTALVGSRRGDWVVPVVRQVTQEYVVFFPFRFYSYTPTQTTRTHM